LPSRCPMPLSIPGQMNQSWSVDFMSDSLADGRTFRTFNVLDDFNRQALGIEVYTDLPAARIIRVLDQIALWRGYPKQIRMDNGPEFISLAMAEWTESHRIHLEFIKPGKPTQNSFVERFNRTYSGGDPELLHFQRSEGGSRTHRGLAQRIQHRETTRIIAKQDTHRISSTDCRKF